MSSRCSPLESARTAALAERTRFAGHPWNVALAARATRVEAAFGEGFGWSSASCIGSGGDGWLGTRIDAAGTSGFALAEAMVRSGA